MFANVLLALLWFICRNVELYIEGQLYCDLKPIGLHVCTAFRCFEDTTEWCAALDMMRECVSSALSLSNYLTPSRLFVYVCGTQVIFTSFS